MAEWGLDLIALLQPTACISRLEELAGEDIAELVDFVVGWVPFVVVLEVQLVELEQEVNNTPAGDSVVDNFLGKGSCRVTE